MKNRHNIPLSSTYARYDLETKNALIDQPIPYR